MALAVAGSCAGCGKLMEAYNASHPSGSNQYYNMLTGLSPQESIYMKLGSHDVATYEGPAQGTLKTYRI